MEDTEAPFFLQMEDIAKPDIGVGLYVYGAWPCEYHWLERREAGRSAGCGSYATDQEPKTVDGVQAYC